MGALHAGHAVLLAHGRALAGKSGTLLASIYVNPLQFGPKEDFARYPRPIGEDLKICRREGVDGVFIPEPGSMNAPDRSVFVTENSLSGVLCGASRPGHFQGVCTVVAQLFLILQPEIAVFGEKDWQQLAVIRRMVRDLSFPVVIESCPTVREPDGLAMSSRNRYLSADERAVAPRIFETLLKLREDAARGNVRVAALRKSALGRLSKIPGARVDYLEIVDSESLRPLKIIDRPATVATAVFLGKTRLIDNLQLLPPSCAGK